MCQTIANYLDPDINFWVVRELIPTGPIILHVDFELEVTSAFQDVYPVKDTTG